MVRCFPGQDGTTSSLLKFLLSPAKPLSPLFFIQCGVLSLCCYLIADGSTSTEPSLRDTPAQTTTFFRLLCTHDSAVAYRMQCHQPSGPNWPFSLRPGFFEPPLANSWPRALYSEGNILETTACSNRLQITACDFPLLSVATSVGFMHNGTRRMDFKTSGN